MAFSIQENEEKRKRQQDEDIRNLLKYIKEFRKVHKMTDKVPLYARTGALCGNTGLHLKITPYHPATDAAPRDKTDDDV